MSFQKQVHGAMRTSAEIEADKQRKIVVYPCATRTETECFPCITIEVSQAGRRLQKTWVELRQFGNHFDTLDAALAAAKRVSVLSVDDAGEVRWEVTQD
jgi:hypothetical protein